MLKSLFSGVAGLQSHQVAMDVESNNIANVNTIGFKYSRANFSDLLAQTNQIATAPQGALGGKNAVQVGLGTTVASVTRIHTQGSIQNSDKNTDVAIQGDGFFIVSGDGGDTYKYTRSGDFKFDANGNFVDNNGFIAQGWLRDPVTNKVDSTAPIVNVVIDPGLTTPAEPTSVINLKANLNSGPRVSQVSAAYAIDATGASTANPPIMAFDDFGVMFNGAGEAFSLTSATTAVANSGQGIRLIIDNGTPEVFDFRYTDLAVGSPNVGADGNNRYFNTTQDFWNELNAVLPVGATVELDDQGRYKITNPVGNPSFVIDVADLGSATGTPDTTLENPRFFQTFTTLSANYSPTATLPATRLSQEINAAVHASSIDVFDSLGSKHTIKIDFRKTGQSQASGSSWAFSVTAPSYANLIGAIAPAVNILGGGVIEFASDGSLLSRNPGQIEFTANNGSASPQQIDLGFGRPGAFDGLTSFDSPSTTSGISQDGFTGGDLLGIRIDQSGTLVGSFSNGRSFGLAQIGMAKFVNNEGLAADGGNVYLQSANSGDPIIGTAASGGRGFIQSAALEASNVDLSRSLTQLIIIQRGYQANGKTITTSDTLLETLIGLKR
ncbi:MAG: flagellar hook-basal body complex protein [Campylobacterales bacterium]|nr:flagellar hook-basal body complex protein [Campylobacterales bacterium]